MRKRFLSALLVFCMVLTLLPGTALAANLPPAETAYWKNLSLSESNTLLAGAKDKTANENFVFVLYDEEGVYNSDTVVLDMAIFYTENTIKTYGF